MPVLLWYIFGNFWYTILFGNFGDIEQIETFLPSVVSDSLDGIHRSNMIRDHTYYINDVQLF